LIFFAQVEQSDASFDKSPKLSVDEEWDY